MTRNVCETYQQPAILPLQLFMHPVSTFPAFAGHHSSPHVPATMQSDWQPPTPLISLYTCEVLSTGKLVSRGSAEEGADQSSGKPKLAKVSAGSTP